MLFMYSIQSAVLLGHNNLPKLYYQLPVNSFPLNSWHQRSSLVTA